MPASTQASRPCAAKNSWRSRADSGYNRAASAAAGKSSAASLGHLRSLDVDYIKIDGSFIRHIDQSEDGRFFLRALAGIAHGLGIRVIAEAVENQAEWDVLKELRIDGVQGYFVGAPQAVSALLPAEVVVHLRV